MLALKFHKEIVASGGGGAAVPMFIAAEVIEDQGPPNLRPRIITAKLTGNSITTDGGGHSIYSSSRFLFSNSNALSAI